MVGIKEVVVTKRMLDVELGDIIKLRKDNWTCHNYYIVTRMIGESIAMMEYRRLNEDNIEIKVPFTYINEKDLDSIVEFEKYGNIITLIGGII